LSALLFPSNAIRLGSILKSAESALVGKKMQISVSGSWPQLLKDGFARLHEWVRSTAPLILRIESRYEEVW